MTNINPTDGPSSHGDATEARGQGQTAEQAQEGAERGAVECDIFQPSEFSDDLCLCGKVFAEHDIAALLEAANDGSIECGIPHWRVAAYVRGAGWSKLLAAATARAERAEAALRELEADLRGKSNMDYSTDECRAFRYGAAKAKKAIATLRTAAPAATEDGAE